MQLPSAIAFGIDQFGTMFGKLNGVIDATTPSGKRSMRHSTPRLTSSTSPGAICGSEQANSRQLGRLEHLGARLAGDLAVLLGDQRGELVDVALEQRLVSVEDLDALLDRRGRPGGERRLRGATRRRRPRRAVESGTREMTSPLLGSCTSSRGRAARRRTRRRRSCALRGTSCVKILFGAEGAKGRRKRRKRRNRRHRPTGGFTF